MHQALAKKEDYREKWTGAYDCEVNVSRWSMDSTGGGSTREYQYQTIIEVIITNDSMMFFLNKEGGSSREARVYRDGSFLETDALDRPWINGNFYKDSLDMTFSSISPGVTSISHYKGKKQK